MEEYPPEEAALFCDPIELVLAKTGREILRVGEAGFLEDVDRIGRIIAGLEELGAVVLECDIQSPDSNFRGGITYRLHYRNSNFVLGYKALGIVCMSMGPD